ncbi:MAG TPA: hypothetical protein VF690_16795 [Hymenobacter sp.]|jgi:hypothetical protein
MRLNTEPAKSAEPASPFFLTDARPGERAWVSALRVGTALVGPILRYYYQVGHRTVYVNGAMLLALRKAHDEVWLVGQRPICIPKLSKAA